MKIKDLVEVDGINYKEPSMFIAIKYGRFIPNQETHFDSMLGVTLASPNQYAKKYVVIKEN